MKAFLAALVATAALTVGADLALDETGFSSADYFKTENVRLGQ